MRLLTEKLNQMEKNAREHPTPLNNRGNEQGKQETGATMETYSQKEEIKVRTIKKIYIYLYI